MRRKVRFELWRTFVDTLIEQAGRHGAKLPSSYRQAERYVMDCVTGDRTDSAPLARYIKRFQQDLIMRSRLAVEYNWHRDRRPYYKVFPEMARMLSMVDLHVDSSYLKPPFNAFTVNLPSDVPVINGTSGAVLVSIEPAATIKQILMADDWPLNTTGIGLIDNMNNARENFLNTVERAERRLETKLLAFMNVHYQTDRDKSNGMFTSEQFHLGEGRDLLHAVDVAEKWWREEQSYDLNDSLAPSARRQLMSVILSVCCFATDNHELVMPDLPREVILKVEAASRRHGPRGERAKQEADAAVRKAMQNAPGWLVGKEVDLPRPTVVRKGSPNEAGGELEYSHVRSGHMRLQACGPKHSERKLVFIAPTVVRPDLPPSPRMKGYRIGDELVAKIGRRA